MKLPSNSVLVPMIEGSGWEEASQSGSDNVIRFPVQISARSLC